MRGWLIILHLLIRFFYLLKLNIVNLISPKITLSSYFCLLAIVSFYNELNFIFTLRKLVQPKNRSSRIISAGPEQLVVVIIVSTYICFVKFTVMSLMVQHIVSYSQMESRKMSVTNKELVTQKYKCMIIHYRRNGKTDHE